MAIEYSKYLSEDKDFLDLSSEKLKKNNEYLSREDLGSLRTFLDDNPKITYLKITGTTLSDELAESLKDAKLSKVELTNNRITKKGIELLIKNSNITELNLNSNLISQENVALLRSRAPHLRVSSSPFFTIETGIFKKPKPLREGISLNENLIADLELNGHKYIEFLNTIVTNKYVLSILSYPVTSRIRTVLKDNDTPASLFLRIFEGIEDSFKKTKPPQKDPLQNDFEGMENSYKKAELPQEHLLQNDNDYALFAALIEIKENHTSKLLQFIHKTFKDLNPQKAAEGVKLTEEATAERVNLIDEATNEDPTAKQAAEDVNLSEEATKITNPKSKP